MADRYKIIRAHNIEHEYYKNLALAEGAFLKKVYFFIEGLRLKYYENSMKYANLILAISEHEMQYFSHKFKNIPVMYISPFHGNTCSNNIVLSDKKYILWHGNLKTKDNEYVLNYLITNIFNNINHHIIIVSNFLPDSIKILLNNNIEYIHGANKNQIDNLILKSHVQLLWSHNISGFKLKLLNAVFLGKFCIANSKMLHGTGLELVCHVADNKEQVINVIEHLWDNNYTEAMHMQRMEVLRNYEDGHLMAKIQQAISQMISHHMPGVSMQVIFLLLLYAYQVYDLYV
ncbi:MAG: hypothetical protein NW207_08655 [Cytophagales bacterium]|nr:hypothetical protein [Cytophagales bacterium]